MRLLNTIDTPFKVGQERTDDDVSLFLLSEFVVHAKTAGTEAEVAPEDVEAQAAAIEEQLVEVEEVQSAELEAAAEAEEEELLGTPARRELTPLRLLQHPVMLRRGWARGRVAGMGGAASGCACWSAR